MHVAKAISSIFYTTYTFPALFVTWSLLQHTPHVYVYFTILDVWSWSCVGLTL